MKKEYVAPQLIDTHRRRGLLTDIIFAEGKPHFLIADPSGAIKTYPGTAAALAMLAHGRAFDFPVNVDFEIDEAGQIVKIDLGRLVHDRPQRDC